jgi:hypothetical protein
LSTPAKLAPEAQQAKIKAHKRLHGECNVPQGWAEDPKLGKWINKQRAYKKSMYRGVRSPGMTAARAAKLAALGLVWSLPAGKESVWEAQLAKLMAYTRKHGDCSVPQSWAEDPRLGRSAYHQRALKKRLDRGEPSPGITAARAAKLDTLGLAWELSIAATSKQRSEGHLNDAGWEAQLVKLKAYRRRHGDCNVKKRWAEDPQLGRWVDNQRTRKKALERGEPSKGMTPARTVKLDAFAGRLRLGAPEMMRV